MKSHVFISFLYINTFQMTENTQKMSEYQKEHQNVSKGTKMIKIGSTGSIGAKIYIWRTFGWIEFVKGDLNQIRPVFSTSRKFQHRFCDEQMSRSEYFRSHIEIYVEKFSRSFVSKLSAHLMNIRS